MKIRHCNEKSASSANSQSSSRHSIAAALNKPAEERFVHAAVTAEGVLDIRLPKYPYGCQQRDSDDPKAGFDAIYCFLILPQTSYLASSSLNAYTVVTALCTPEPRRFTAALENLLDEEYISLLRNTNPSKIERIEFKKHIASSLAAPLVTWSFVISVALPKSLLALSYRNPKVGYQAIISTVVLPILNLHSQDDLKFHQFHAIITSVGEFDLAVRKMMKKAASVFPGDYSVKFSNEMTEDWSATILGAAKFVRWAVNALYHPDPNPHWVELLSRKK